LQQQMQQLHANLAALWADNARLNTEVDDLEGTRRNLRDVIRQMTATFDEDQAEKAQLNARLHVQLGHSIARWWRALAPRRRRHARRRGATRRLMRSCTSTEVCSLLNFLRACLLIVALGIQFNWNLARRHHSYVPALATELKEVEATFQELLALLSLPLCHTAIQSSEEGWHSSDVH